MDQFALIAVIAIFSSNIVSALGVGAVTLQSEKRNFWFALTSSMCIILSTIIAGLTYFVINEYMLVKLEAEFLKLFVVILLSSILAFITHIVLKKASKEMIFLYERSYSLPIQIAVTAGTLIAINFNQTFSMVMFELAMFSVGFLLVQMLFYPLYQNLDSKYNFKPARNVPVMLYTLALVGMILYSIAMFF